MEALSSRPDADSMVISSTGEVEHLRQRFSSQSVVAWSVGETADRVDINTFPDDVRIAFRIHRLDIQVTKYHPEDYFVTLSKQADRESILRQSRLETPSGRVYQFSPWTERRHGQRVKLRYRVRLCLEGIPMHGRTEAVAAKAVGRQCSVHYVEEYSRRRTYNRTYDLWVRTADLSYIHKASWLTLTDADEELPSTEIPLVELEPHRNPLPEGEKRGELYFVLIHVDTVEDLRTMESRSFPWRYGVQDAFDRLPPQPRTSWTEPDPAWGPDDDADRDRRSRGRHRSRSLQGRFEGRSSSRSREPEQRERQVQNQDNRGRDRTRHRASHRSRSRRSREPLNPPPNMVEPRPASPTPATPTPPSPTEEAVRQLQAAELFLDRVTTPTPAPILPTPPAAARRLCKSKHFNKPLPPDSLKTIMALVEKGGCKAMRLKSAKKKATVVPI
ncbi:uncharacterized protein LOC102706247 [Oryza brachyantha]|uniref:uncharacterized protein LOC102706247 n=1 Tax=Oryza brachyantha TaxID=4533 RepID=UPI001AD9E475|nr:uncharacterized protein LOC102706247 [Oryza brachyantha]